MKLALVCNDYPPLPHCGIGTFVHTLAHGLRSRGHQVAIVGLAANPGRHTDEGIDVFTLRRSKLRYLGNLISRIRLHRWLCARIRAGRIDLIEAPDSEGLLPFHLPCPVVIRLHQTGTSIALHSGLRIPPGLSRYERRTLAVHPQWIAVSHHILETTERVFRLWPRRWVVMNNPVPTRPACIAAPPIIMGDYVLFASSVSRIKGALTLAEAAREVMASRPNLHLVYLGGGVSREGKRPIAETIREILGADLAARVHFAGHVSHDQVLASMMRARVFVFPSRLEAFPLAPLEAMSCGTPTVCSSCPPLPEMIEDGVTGLLADPECPHDFAEKIGFLLNHPEFAARLAENGRKAVTRCFTLDRCLDATEHFYQECLGEFSVEARGRMAA